MTPNWEDLLCKSQQDLPPDREASLALLRLPDHQTLRLVEVAFQVRRHFFGDRVMVNVLTNAKSGLCSEDCHYCSQSNVSQADIQRYPMIGVEEIVTRARAAREAGGGRFCLAISTREANWREIETVCEATRQIKQELPIEVCVSMGAISEDKARALREAGVDAYNHNLNTSPDHYASICTTHRYEDRVATVEILHRVGLSVCCGVLLGMGESDEDVVEMAFALRQAAPESLPVNFLIPIAGTPLAEKGTTRHLTPWACLRYLSLFRLVNPRAALRASAGRELYLRTLQPLALMVANSLFLGGYLTSEGQSAEADWRMIHDLGLTPERE